MMPDLFRRLKPVFGKRIDDLWIAYQLGDSSERRQIEELLTVLAVKHLGIAIGDEKIVLEPPRIGVVGKGEFLVGNVEYPGLPRYPFTLHRPELLRHIFLLGPTGTGKSTLIIGLLRQFLRDGLQFWCLDFKRNYRCLLDDKNGDAVVVVTVGRGTAPVALNMLRAPPGVEQDEWVEALADIISTSYLLLHGARNVLKSALLAAMATKGSAATVHDARDLAAGELSRARGGSRRYGWLESTHRTLEELSKLGDAVCATSPVSFEELLTRPVVFELQSLGDDQRRCFCLYLLQALLLLRKHQPDEREVLRHILVFDEAHNVFPKDQWGELSIPSRLAREVREYGEGIIAATQQADVADSLIANSGTKIILRTDYPKDVDFASKLLQIDPRWLAKIPLGQGIVRLATRYYQPFLFSFPEQSIKNQLITDEQIQNRYAQWKGKSWTVPTAPASEHEDIRTEAMPDREHSLLADIAAHPISTVTQRYERLGWNPKTGNAVKNRLIGRALATFVVLDIPKSHVKILALTDAGIAYAIEHELPVAARGRAGVEHEFWRARIKERCEARGYNVTQEYPVNGGRVDLHATNGKRTFLIEIETGQSDIKKNIEKCSGRPEILIVFFTTDHAYRTMRSRMAAGVTVLAPSMLDELHNLLMGFTELAGRRA